MTTNSFNTDPLAKGRQKSTARQATPLDKATWKACRACQFQNQRRPGSGVICYHHLAEWLGQECQCTDCGGTFVVQKMEIEK